jgi:DNA-binding NarL/FixJ family response regulator
VKILIADDHAVLREGVKQILADEFPQAQFGEARSTTEALECLRREPWDVLVLDVFMPGRDGLDALQESRRDHPDVPVLVLSSAPEEQLGLRVLRAGASGYVNKRTAPEDLVRAIRKVLAGGKYVTAALAEQLVAGLTRSEARLHEHLSNREFQVMRLLLQGQSLKEIANELSLSVKTVTTFHTRIWDKLHLRNDVELVHYALAHGLMPQ